MSLLQVARNQVRRFCQELGKRSAHPFVLAELAIGFGEVSVGKYQLGELALFEVLFFFQYFEDVGQQVLIFIEVRTGYTHPLRKHFYANYGPLRFGVV